MSGIDQNLVVLAGSLAPSRRRLATRFAHRLGGHQRGLALVVAALAALAGATALTAQLLGPRLAAVAPSAAALAPDPAAVHYRHALTPPDEAADPAIPVLEQRVVGPHPSPFDLAELADLYLRRAKLSGDLKDYAACEAAAERSLQLLPAPNGAVLALAKVANARHQFRRAIELALQHRQGRSTGASTVLATAHLALGELAAASAAAEALVAAQPSSAAYLMRALVLQAQGRDAEASFDFTRAALAEEEGDPQEAARLRALWARFLIKRGELAGATTVLDEALRIAPEHPLALAQRGELALRTGEARRASALFERAFASSRQVRYLIDQARALQLSGDRTGATTLREQVEQLVRAELTEGGVGHRLDLIEVLLDRGDSTDLAEVVAMAREEVAQRGSAEARFQLARALARAGGEDEALAQVQAALAGGAREAQLYQLAAELERRRHNAARAALYQRLALELDPGDSGWRQAAVGPR